MICIQLRDKTFNFDEEEVKVLKVDKEGNARRLDVETDTTDWSDVVALVAAERERTGAQNIYG